MECYLWRTRLEFPDSGVPIAIGIRFCAQMKAFLNLIAELRGEKKTKYGPER